MSYTNAQMDVMKQSLDKYLDRRDLIGYAAARNARILDDELATFIEMKNKAIIRNGEEEHDQDGNVIGVSLKRDSEGFKKFVDEMSPLMDVECEPRIFKIKFDQAIGVLSGSEILELDWMFED